MGRRRTERHHTPLGGQRVAHHRGGPREGGPSQPRPQVTHPHAVLARDDGVPAVRRGRGGGSVGHPSRCARAQVVDVHPGLGVEEDPAAVRRDPDQMGDTEVRVDVDALARRPVLDEDVVRVVALDVPPDRVGDPLAVTAHRGPVLVALLGGRDQLVGAGLRVTDVQQPRGLASVAVADGVRDVRAVGADRLGAAQLVEAGRVFGPQPLRTAGGAVVQVRSLEAGAGGEGDTAPVGARHRRVVGVAAAEVDPGEAAVGQVLQEQARREALAAEARRGGRERDLAAVGADRGPARRSVGLTAVGGRAHPRCPGLVAPLGAPVLCGGRRRPGQRDRDCRAEHGS